jgi:hypothetical protein
VAVLYFLDFDSVIAKYSFVNLSTQTFFSAWLRANNLTAADRVEDSKKSVEVNLPGHADVLLLSEGVSKLEQLLLSGEDTVIIFTRHYPAFVRTILFDAGISAHDLAMLKILPLADEININEIFMRCLSVSREDKVISEVHFLTNDATTSGLISRGIGQQKSYDIGIKFTITSVQFGPPYSQTTTSIYREKYVDKPNFHLLAAFRIANGEDLAAVKVAKARRLGDDEFSIKFCQSFYTFLQNGAPKDLPKIILNLKHDITGIEIDKALVELKLFLDKAQKYEGRGRLTGHFASLRAKLFPIQKLFLAIDESDWQQAFLLLDSLNNKSQALTKLRL